jgi:hypothetical protein
MADDPTTIAPLDTDSKVVLEDATPPPATDGGAAETPPASSGEGSSPDPAPEADPPKADPPPETKSNRERLIAKLTGEEDAAPPKAEEPETPAATEPQAKEPTPKEGDTPKPDKTPEPAKDEDLSELTNETAAKLKPGEVRRKINRLLERVKSSEPLAKGFQEIVETCEKNGFSPDDYKAWVHLGIGIQNGDEGAVQRFAALAEKMGITAPAAPTIPPDLDAWLETQAKDLEISATATAELRKRLGLTGAPAPAAAPAPRPAPAPAPRQPQPQAPAPNPEIAIRSRATQEIGRLADEYEKRIGADNFKALEPRIMTELAKRKGKHPDAWPDIFRSVVESELARAPKPASVQGNLRPGGSSAPASQPAFKTERERLLHKYTS